jgi:hypothetical protein
MRASLLCIVVVAFSIAVSSGASAAPPVRDRFSVHLTGFAPAVSAFCGFRIERDIAGDLIDTTFVDGDGNAKRFLEVAPGFKVSFTNPANGITVTYPNVFSVHQTFNADGSIDEATVGLVFRVIVPGQGPVAINTGRLLLHISPSGVVTVLQDAGPSDSFQAVCDALSGT